MQAFVACELPIGIFQKANAFILRVPLIFDMLNCCQTCDCQNDSNIQVPAIIGFMHTRQIGLERDESRQVSLPRKRYSKWMKHQ